FARERCALRIEKREIVNDALFVEHARLRPRALSRISGDGKVFLALTARSIEDKGVFHVLKRFEKTLFINYGCLGKSSIGRIDTGKGFAEASALPMSAGCFPTRTPRR